MQLMRTAAVQSAAKKSDPFVLHGRWLPWQHITTGLIDTALPRIGKQRSASGHLMTAESAINRVLKTQPRPPRPRDHTQPRLRNQANGTTTLSAMTPSAQ